MVQIDIEMPIYCSDCPCHNGENGRCNITGDSTYDKRPFDCPLKEVKLADLPSAQPARKKGKWEMKWQPFFHIEVPMCSACKTFAACKIDVCPHCGADMREENKIDNLISRQAAIDLCDTIIERDKSGENVVVEAIKAWKNCVLGLPSAQPEREKGKWIDKGDYCVCNQCGHTEQQFNGVELIPLHTPFCAICGAEMEKNDAEAEIH